MTYDECAEDFEDEFGIVALEPTHTDEDEQWYLDCVLGPWSDEDEARDSDYYEGPDDDFDPDDWKEAQNAWECGFWGD